MTNINDDGYLILKNVLSPNQLQNGLNSDNNGIIDYQMMRNFIDNDFMPTIITNTQIIKKPIYIKFRYSNNNNSTDASTFHSDIYNFTNDNIMPIYTCLCYFDKTKMEVIPGSHKKEFHNQNSCLSSYNKKKLITIEPGDIVVFHANLYHRGTNFNVKENRRLLQVFEVFPDYETLSLNYNRFVTVLTGNTASLSIINNLSYYISKIPFLINNICFLHYLLVYNNLQYKIILNDVDPWNKNNKLITYEPGRRMNYENITGYDPINTNIICIKSITTKPGYFYLICLVFIIFIIIIICMFSNKKIKKFKKFNKK